MKENANWFQNFARKFEFLIKNKTNIFHFHLLNLTMDKSVHIAAIKNRINNDISTG